MIIIIKKLFKKKNIFYKKKIKKNNNNKIILMHITLLPSLKKIGLHLWQLLHGNSNNNNFGY